MGKEKKRKKKDFLMGFYIFHDSGLKLSKNSQLKNFLKISVNETLYQ